MENKSANFIGDYLLNQGVITRAMLDEALAYQRERNKFVGTIAFEKGYMTQEQISSVYAAQKKSDKAFGDIAMGLGFLNRNQLNDVLFTKTVNHVYLGEALIEKGFLSLDKFSALINDFCDFKNDRVRRAEHILRSLCEHEVIVLLIETIKKVFYRFSTLEVEFDDVCDSFQDEPFDSGLGAELSLASGREILFSLFFPRRFFTDYFDSFVGPQELVDDLYSSIAMEIFGILLSYLQSCLDTGGLAVTKVTPIPYSSGGVECPGEAFLIRLATTRGPLGLCYECR